MDEIDPPLAELEAGFPDVRFLTFGFGERAFVVDRKQDFGTMLSALLPSQAAVLTTALQATPQAAFGADNVVVLHISRDGLARIQAKLWHSLELSPSNEPTPLGQGPYPGSAYFAARETYSGLFTCNTWTAEMIGTGGLPMPAGLVLFAGQVMGQARWIAARQARWIATYQAR